MPREIKRSLSQSLLFLPVERSYSSTESGFSAWGVTRRPCRRDGYSQGWHTQLLRDWEDSLTYIGIKGRRVVDDTIIPACNISSFPPAKVSYHTPTQMPAAHLHRTVASVCCAKQSLRKDNVASDSAFGTLTIRVTKPGLTNTDLRPVTGWTRTTG